MAFFKLALPSRFEVVRRIGSGGMGVVYEAVDLERHERVALKTILHHDADTIARVKHEFRALQDIHHPNLVGLRELVADADDVFFTMELVDGVELREWVGGRARRASTSNAPTAANIAPANGAADGVATPLPASGVVSTRGAAAPPSSGESTFDEARLRDAFRQIALGLSALHAAAKVHRDVKPSNVRVTPVSSRRSRRSPTRSAASTRAWCARAPRCFGAIETARSGSSGRWRPMPRPMRGSRERPRGCSWRAREATKRARARSKRSSKRTAAWSPPASCASPSPRSPISASRGRDPLHPRITGRSSEASRGRDRRCTPRDRRRCLASCPPRRG